MSAGCSLRLVTLTLVAAFGLVLPSRADDADDRYAVAAAHYDAGRWKLAVEEFGGLLATYPQYAKATQSTFFLAEALLQLKRFDEAALQYQRCLQRDPKGQYAREALFRQGEAEYFLRQSPRARKTLAEFVDRYPRDPLCGYALPYLGDLAAGDGDWGAAARYYRQGLEQFPSGHLQDDCRLGLARALEKQGQSEEAEKLYLALSAKTSSPLSGEAMFHLGALQFSAGRYADAAATLETFDARWPASPRRGEAQLALAWSRFKLKRAAEAKSMLQALVTDPTVGVDARYWLGMIDRAEEHWADGAAVLQAGIAANPKHRLSTAMRFYAADCLLHAGDTVSAGRLFEQVLAAPDNPLSEAAGRGKVQAALQAGDHAAIDREAERFQRRFPRSPLLADVRRMLARSLLDRGQPQRVIDLLRPVVSKAAADENIEERYLLALAYDGVKCYQEGLATVLPVASKASSPLKASAQLLQGSLLLAMKRHSEAIAPLEAALAARTLAGDDLLRAKAQRAIALARAGKIDLAKRAFSELAAQPPNGALILATNEQLAEAAYAAGDTAWAGELFGRLAEHATGQQQRKGLAGVAWCLYKAGKLAEAADGFAKLLDKAPEPGMAAEAALARGQALEQLGRVQDALAMYDQVASRYATTEFCAPALLAAARLHAARREYGPAARLFARLADHRPPPAELDAVLYEWSWVLADGGKPLDSVKPLERIRQEFPKSRFWADAVYRLAQRAWEAKNYGQAGRLAADLLAARPEPRLREHALYLSGQVAAAQERWPDVARLMEQVTSEFPKSVLRAAAEYWVAESLYRRQEYDAAGKRLERLSTEIGSRREPWMGMIAMRRAQVLGYQKKWEEAYAIASKIAADFPGFEQQYEVDYLLGRALADRADFEGARNAYQRVLHSPGGAKTETAAMAQWMIGESYFHQKNYEAALREYLRVEILYAYPRWQALALLQAGKCHELLGEWREAADLYQRVLARYADTPAAKDAAGRLKSAQQQLARLPSNR